MAGMNIGNGKMQTGEIRASIVMPAYNAASDVRRSIGSALAQTEPRCEVLVIDDASNDNTVAVVRQLAEHDGRVRLLRNAVNRGPAASRNRGFAEARGDWIALLDADDEFAPHRIETLISLGERHAADLVADNLLLCPENGIGPAQAMIPAWALPVGGFLSLAVFVAGNVGSRHTPRVSYGFLQPIIRREFLQAHDLRYQESNRFGEDFLLYVACLLNGARWWVTPEAMYRYTVRPGSLTDVQSAADLQRIRSVESALLCNDALLASDPDLASALRRHKAVIDRFYYYRAFVDALRARAASRVLRVLFESPLSLPYIVQESLLRAPKITMKALRGGYRVMPRAMPRSPPGTGGSGVRSGGGGAPAL
jgi:glycosyltransferase involved in cell wall biosynthesis